MPLALPLLIPFAEIAGIAIGAVTTGVGLKALSDKVEDYIEDNPEQAEKIFAMIMPEQGLASIFNTEADDGEEELGEIETPKLTGKEKGKAMADTANSETGNYSDPNASDGYASKRGRMIKKAEDLGLANPDLKDNYKPSDYTGWKKFANKYKKKYEDGGMTGYAHGGGVGSMMQPKKNFEMQGGVQNHLGEQKMVTVPQKWQSAEDHPSTELAYITQKEKDLLIKKDLHKSLNGSVNRGPEGVMSLNGWGSTDSGQNVSGATASAAETGGNTERDRADFRAAGMSPQLQQDFRNAAINAGAGQRVNPGFFDSNTFLSPGEIAGAKAYRQNPINKYANQSYRNTGQSGIMNMIKSGGLFGSLIKNLGQRFGLGKRYNDTSTSISEDFNNLPLGGSAAFNNLDIRDKFNRTQDKPTAKVTMANGQTITSDQINEFGDGRTITSDQIDEFGDNRNINMDEFGGNRDISANQINEFGDNRNINIDEFATTGKMNQNAIGQDYGMYSGLPNQKQTNTAAMEVMSNAYNNSLPPPSNYNTGTEYGLQRNEGIMNPDLLYDDFNNGEVAYYPAEHRLANLTNSELPGNNIVAGNYSQNAVGKQLYGKEYDVLNPFEQQQIDKAIDTIGTRSTGELARNGGIMGYNGY